MRSQSTEEKIGTKRSNGIWRNVCNEELYVLNSACNYIRFVKSSRIKWVLHETFVREMKIRAKY